MGSGSQEGGSGVWGRVWERVKGHQQHKDPCSIALHVSHLIESKPHRREGAERDEETLKASWNIGMNWVRNSVKAKSGIQCREKSESRLKGISNTGERSLLLYKTITKANEEILKASWVNCVGSGSQEW